MLTIRNLSKTYANGVRALRDVALDYVKPLALRVGVLAALAFGLAGLALWMLRILLFSQH